MDFPFTEIWIATLVSSQSFIIWKCCKNLDKNCLTHQHFKELGRKKGEWQLEGQGWQMVLKFRKLFEDLLWSGIWLTVVICKPRAHWKSSLVSPCGCEDRAAAAAPTPAPATPATNAVFFTLGRRSRKPKLKTEDNYSWAWRQNVGWPNRLCQVWMQQGLLDDVRRGHGAELFSMTKQTPPPEQPPVSAAAAASAPSWPKMIPSSIHPTPSFFSSIDSRVHQRVPN